MENHRRTDDRPGIHAYLRAPRISFGCELNCFPAETSRIKSKHAYKSLTFPEQDTPGPSVCPFTFEPRVRNLPVRMWYFFLVPSFLVDNHAPWVGDPRQNLEQVAVPLNCMCWWKRLGH